ncbi:MAG: ribonuclease Z [Saprospiraceae bacterium]
MKFEITILGCSAAYPANGLFTTSQVLNINEKYYLIDCGEGTQAQLRKYRIKASKINHIFISHVHGDHILGLPGVIGSFGLLGRVAPLHIHCPEGVKEFVEAFIKYTNVRKILYPLHFHVHQSTEPTLLLDNEDLTVTTIPLKHDVPTAGFLFKEKERPRNMKKEAIQKYNIPYQHIPAIKKGGNFTTTDGKVITNNELTKAAKTPRSYAFCSDTAYTETILSQIQAVDLLYHEATFGDEKLEDLQERDTHSTARQAAIIAQKAKTKRLIIGHFSPRYKDLDVLLAQAREVFKKTDLAIDGRVFNV